MNTQQLISSGDLEQYVLGLCAPEEAARIEQAAAADPLIRAELDALHEAYAGFARAEALSPPPALRSRVLNQIEQLAANEPKTARGTSGASILRMQPYWMVAAAAVLLVSLTANYLFYNRWQRADEKLAVLQTERTQMAERLNVFQTRFALMPDELKAMSDPHHVHFALKDQQGNEFAMIYWNTQTKEVFFGSHNLPAPPPGKQYQLWSIVNGKPIDAGVISAHDGMLRLKVVEKADVFAITLEREGGVQIPEGKPLVLATVQS